MTILQIETKTVYKNRWMTVREDLIERSDGQRGIYGVVDKPDFVVVIPFDGENLYLVEQFRYPVSGRFWELPQGSWEDEPDVLPEKLARGELREETGLSAGSLKYLGHLFEAYGYANQGMHVFLASDLKAGDQELDSEEEGLLVGKFSLREAMNLIKSGAMKDSASLAALALWRLSDCF